MANPMVPTRLKILRGTFRSDRANPAEPSPEPLTAQTPPPAWLGLSSSAQQIWLEVLPLCPLGVLTVLDVGLLGRWSELQVDRTELRIFLRKHGRSISLLDVNGNVRAQKARPECNDLRACETEIRHIESAMGFSPVSRSRVSAIQFPSEDCDLDREIFGD